MARFSVILWLSYLLLITRQSSDASYDGHEVWRISHPNGVSSDFVIVFEDLSLDVWGMHPLWTDVRVSPEQIQHLDNLIYAFGLEKSTKIEDVGRLISETSSKNNRNVPSDKQSRVNFDFSVYHSLDEIMTFLDDLEAESDYVSSAIVSQTVEGRDLRTMTVSVPSNETKPVIWIDCGIHAREWITEATCVYGLNYLVDSYGTDPDTTDFLDTHDVVMLPVLNPDGYDYSWTTDRLWRKNRHLYAGETCVGVDLNRNYDGGNFGGVGASNRSCADTFHGPEPFSEYETSAVRDSILALQDKGEVKSFYSIHSYGQLWMYAFAYQSDLPLESDELQRVSQVGVDAIESLNGTKFTNGPHFTTIYPASGTSVDWGYSIGVVQSYIVELRDTGEYGFILPEEQILPTAQETWKGIIAAVMAI